MILAISPFWNAVLTGSLVALVAALLAALGWLITTQVATNKSLTKSVQDILTDLKLYMSDQQGRAKVRELMCAQHRSGMSQDKKDLEHKIRALERRVAVMSRKIGLKEKREKS